MMPPMHERDSVAAGAADDTSPFGRQAAALIGDEAAILSTLRPDRAWRYSTNRGNAGSLEAYELALSMPGAAHALALLRIYADFVDLGMTDTWSVSAMPKYSGPWGERRFATINSGGVELFYVLFATGPGTVTQWGLRLDRSVQPSRSTWAEPHEGGDTSIGGENLGDLLAALDDASIASAVRATRQRRQHKRRESWHNVYLAHHLCPQGHGSAGGTRPHTPHPDASPSGPDAQDIIERRYIERVVRQRLHQRLLRRRALRHYDQACAYCGTTVPETLDVAHLVADSAGGEASMSNVRLLCANHHRALDAGLLTWDGTGFCVAADSPPVPPVPQSPPGD